MGEFCLAMSVGEIRNDSVDTWSVLCTRPYINTHHISTVTSSKSLLSTVLGGLSIRRRVDPDVSCTHLPAVDDNDSISIALAIYHHCNLGLQWHPSLSVNFTFSFASIAEHFGQ